MTTAQKTTISTILAISLASMLFAEQPDSLQSFTFRFNPGEEETTYVQRMSTVRTKDLGDLGKQVDETRGEASILIARTESGFHVTATIISTEIFRDGQPVNNPIANALQSIEMTYVLDQDGRLLEVGGVDEALSELFASLPEDAAAAVSKLVNAEMLAAREAAEWNGRIGDFIGATVSLGETWEAEAPFQLPSGTEIPFHTHISFNQPLDCGACDCLEILTAYTSDASDLAELVSETLSGVVESAGGSSSASVEFSESIEGSSRRVIDPSTMRIYSERMERTMTMMLEQPGRDPIPMTMLEVREYEFEYEESFCGGS